MSFDVEQHVRYRIANAPLQPYPFAHFFVPEVFPADYYRELLRRMPELGAYVPIEETGSVGKGNFEERYVCELAEAVADEAAGGGGGLWKDLSAWLMGESFMKFVVGKFSQAIEEQFGRGAKFSLGTDCRLVRDFTNYAIAPHTDTATKLVSLLFYLPADASHAQLGTSIYVPQDAGFRSDGAQHLGFAGFKHVARMDYLPNSLFAFLRTDWSFHGVEPIREHDVERNLMLYNVYAPRVHTPAKAD